MMHLLRKYDVSPLRSAMMRCLPQCAVRHASLGVAIIIGQRPASFAEGKHHSKNAPLSVDKSAFFVGGNGEISSSRLAASHLASIVALRPWGAMLLACSLVRLRFFRHRRRSALSLSRALAFKSPPSSKKGHRLVSFFTSLYAIKGQLNKRMCASVKIRFELSN